MVALEFTENAADWFKPRGRLPQAEQLEPPPPPQRLREPEQPVEPDESPETTATLIEKRDNEISGSGEASVIGSTEPLSSPEAQSETDLADVEPVAPAQREAVQSERQGLGPPAPRQEAAYPHEARALLAQHVTRFAELSQGLELLEEKLKLVSPVDAMEIVKQRRETLDMVEHLRNTLPETERKAKAEHTAEMEGRFAAAWTPLVAEREDMIDDLVDAVEALQASLGALRDMTRRQGAALDMLRGVRDPSHTQYAIGQGDIAVMAWVIRQIGGSQTFPQISQYLPMAESLRGAQHVGLRPKT